MRVIIVVLVCAFAMPGCVSFGGEQNQVSVAGNAAADGTETKALACGENGHIAVALNVASGTLRASVTDAAGQSVWSGTYTGPAQTSVTEQRSGAAGDWTLTVTRSGGWSGQYEVTLGC